MNPSTEPTGWPLTYTSAVLAVPPRWSQIRLPAQSTGTRTARRYQALPW